MSLVAPLWDSEPSGGLIFFVFDKNSSALDLLGLQKYYPLSHTVLAGNALKGQTGPRMSGPTLGRPRDGPPGTTQRQKFLLQNFISCVSVFVSLERDHSSWGRIALFRS